MEWEETHFSVILVRGSQVYEHFYIFVALSTRLELCVDDTLNIPRCGKGRDSGLPSSGLSRYLSNIGSSLTTCCVAVDRMDALCELKSLDWKYRFQNSASDNYTPSHRQLCG